MARPQLERAQRVAAAVLAAVPRPVVVRGLAYVRWACCDAPAHARAWAVEEAKVAATMWAAMATPPAPLAASASRISSSSMTLSA